MATTMYETNKPKNGATVIYKRCLGVFACPEFECGFVSRPKVPQRKQPMPRSTKAFCSNHEGVELRYIPCNATLKIEVLPDEHCVLVSNKGRHLHPKPHKIRPPPRKLKVFEEIVRNAHEASQLVCQLELLQESQQEKLILHFST